MRDSHFCEMRWYSEISTAAFCESLDLVCPLSQSFDLQGNDISKAMIFPLDPKKVGSRLQEPFFIRSVF